MNYMTFDGVPCEELGLKLIEESVMWQPAPHKGGMLDVPGGSQPVNYSELVSGQPEYAPGGDGENARFLVRPSLLGQADTRGARQQIVTRAKRLLHGRTVELSDLFHQQYTVSAVCSVEVEETWSFTTINLTWQRDPVRLLEPGRREIPVAWEQAAFDPDENLLLELPSHPDVDTSLCGWDYAPVETPAIGLKPGKVGMGSLCVYRVLRYGDAQPDEPVATIGGRPPNGYWANIQYMLFDEAAAASGAYSAEPMLMKVLEGRKEQMSEEGLIDLFKRAVPAGEYFCAGTYQGGRTGEGVNTYWPDDDGWPASSGVSAPDGYRGFMRGGDISTTGKNNAGVEDGDFDIWPLFILARVYSLPAASRISGYDDMNESYEEPMYVRSPLLDALLGEYNTCYGTPLFSGYSGYYRYAEPGDDSFPGITHGMNPVPEPWLLDQDEAPSWYAARSVPEYSWRYKLVEERPRAYVQFHSAGTPAYLCAEDSAGDSSAWIIKYFTGTTDADCRLYLPDDVYDYIDEASGEVSWRWWGRYDSYESTSTDPDVAREEFIAHVNRGAGGEVSFYYDYSARGGDGAYVHMTPRLVSYFGSGELADGGIIAGDFDYGGYYVWDKAGAGMRQAGPGDSWEPGKVYSDRVAREAAEVDTTPVCLYRTFNVSRHVAQLDATLSYRVIEYVQMSAAEARAASPSFSSYSFLVKRAAGAVTQADVDYFSAYAAGHRLVRADGYVGNGWPKTPQEGDFDYANSVAFYAADGEWRASAVVDEGAYAVTGGLLSLLRSMYPEAGTSYDPAPLADVPAEFAAYAGATGADVGYHPGLFTAADRWTDGRIFTAAEEPQAVPEGLSPTYLPGLFRATFPEYAETVTEDVDTGYAFCIEADTTHPATLYKDGLSCSLRGGALLTDLPMREGANTVEVSVPYSEADDGEGGPLAPAMSLSWKRGDV